MIYLFACGVARVVIATLYCVALVQRPDLAERLALPFGALVLAVCVYDLRAVMRR